MGHGYTVKCNKCGYEFCGYLGVGMLFPVVYQENIDKMKNGDLGPEAKIFFDKYPNGVIDSEKAVTKCKICGTYDSVYDFTMYKPKDDTAELEKVSYKMMDDIKKSYIKCMEFPHRCTKCGGRSKVYKSFVRKAEKSELKCPKCDGMMGIKPGYMLMWD